MRRDHSFHVALGTKMRAAFLLPALAFLATSLYLAEAQTSQKISKFFPTPVSVKVLALNGAATGWYSSA